MGKQDWRQVIESIALDAAKAVKPLLGTSEARKVLGTGAGGDQTNFIDDIAERIILDGLERTGEPLHVITEERGLVYLNGGHNKPTRYLIIDPIDGSFNAERGIPAVSISIAAAIGPKVSDLSEAVVLNIPTGDVYSAEKGKGAKLNGHTIKVPVPGPTSLHDASMGIDLNPKRSVIIRSKYVTELATLIDIPKKIRVLGSNALGTCLVASGALDCFVDLRCNLRLLDIAGAYLIVNEAGGLVFSFENGAMHDLESKPLHVDAGVSIVAVGSHSLKAEIQDILRFIGR
nr:inositol monophosphatase family protein [Candidatus Sigynarchaeota archaeon]